MRLYFLRHAEALDGANDAVRPLSPRGREQCRQIGRWLAAAGIEIDAAYSSPLVRAKQTAELVLKWAGAAHPESLTIVPALLNETSAPAFARWLKTLATHHHILLVGHAPTLADRVRGLLGMAQPDALKLPKAGLACIDTDDAKTGALKFFVTPKVI